MGLFGKLRRKEDRMDVVEEKNTLYLPIAGEVIPMEEINDGVFSAGVLGMGCGIKPEDETVYAPASGVITTVADTMHAVGLLTDDGIEILIHVGMDTVDMNGEGFSVFVKPQQKVRCGQQLLKFSMSKITATGHPTTTAFIVTNSDDLSNVAVLSTGRMDKLTAVIKAE